MRSGSNQAAHGAAENASDKLTRRLEREERRRRERKRAIILMIGLASAGVVLLSAVGVLLAARPADADGPAAEKTAASVTAPAPTAEQPALALAAGDSSAGASTGTPEPADPPAPTADPAAPAPKAPAKPAAKKSAAAVAEQRFTIDIGDAGYAPSVVVASSASPITLTVGKGEGCAAGFTIPALGIEKDNSIGPVTFSLGRLEAGTYRFACEMDMVEGKIVVK